MIALCRSTSVRLCFLVKSFLVMGFLVMGWLQIAVPCEAQQVTESGTKEKVDPGFCIIRPEEPASIEIFADYNGKRFYFCCDSCRVDFLSDPSRFDGLGDRGEPAIALADLPEDPYASTVGGRVGRAVLAMERGYQKVSKTLRLEDPPSATIVGLASLWSVFLVYCLRRKRKGLSSFVSLSAAALVVVALLLSFYAAYLRCDLIATTDRFQHAQKELNHTENMYRDLQDRDKVHYGTFINFGSPPIPRRSKSPPSLQKTYYRGNDERSSDMFNGGNYRTVTFKLWIEDSSGEPVSDGTKIIDSSGQPEDLQLVVRFIRAPETSSGYFTDQYMKRMYVTMQAGEFLGRDERVPDRMQWKMTVPETQWVARYPLPVGKHVPIRRPEATASRRGERNGIVYLCEERYESSRTIGGRFHYAIQYELLTDQGTVLPASDLWMQATYYGRNFAELQIDSEEWLSSRPIPEK